MGFNKRYLPDVEVLMERRSKASSDEEFLKDLLGKSDSLMGSTESFDFISTVESQIKKNRSNKED